MDSASFEPAIDRSKIHICHQTCFGRSYRRNKDSAAVAPMLDCTRASGDRNCAFCIYSDSCPFCNHRAPSSPP
jgi:hypothetical protein